MSMDTSKEDLLDFSYTTPDCLHLNQKGHALSKYSCNHYAIYRVSKKCIHQKTNLCKNCNTHLYRDQGINATYFLLLQLQEVLKYH